jgi:hypothetical protein
MLTLTISFSSGSIACSTEAEATGSSKAFVTVPFCTAFLNWILSFLSVEGGMMNKLSL